MVQEILFNLLTSIIELLRLSFILAIPMFVSALIIKFINSRLSSKFGMGFAKASFISTYLVVLALIIVLYFYPVYLGFAESPLTQQLKPPQFAISLADFFAAIPAFTIKFLLDALVFTILLLPLEFIALFVFDYIKNKYNMQKTIGIFLASFVTAIVVVLVLLFVFPFVPIALIRLLYFT